MANKTPPARTSTLHTPNTIALLAAAEATAIAAGDTITFQNSGNVILRFVVTTPGTGTIVALNPANNVALTLAAGDNLIGPLDPVVFGTTVTITTASAVGSCAVYVTASRFVNAVHNPFAVSAIAVDA